MDSTNEDPDIEIESSINQETTTATSVENKETSNSIRCFISKKIFSFISSTSDQIYDCVMIFELFNLGKYEILSIFLATDILPALFVMRQWYLNNGKRWDWKILLLAFHPFNMVAGPMVAVANRSNKKILDAVDDIYACNTAIEAPFQFFVTIMVASTSNDNDKISLMSKYIIWWPFLTTSFSICGIIYGSHWIIDPLSKAIGEKVIGFFIYLAIFSFRLLSWLFIVIVIAEHSSFVILAIFIVNIVVLVKTQPDQCVIEKISTAILSLVLPMHKLPSTSTEDWISLKALTLFVCCGNLLLMFSIGLIWKYRSYLDPLPMQLKIEWFSVILLIIFVFATLPSFLIYFFKPIENGATEATAEPEEVPLMPASQPAAGTVPAQESTLPKADLSNKMATDGPIDN